MLERLRCEEELRIFIDGTRNMGHQSASLNLAQLLIERSGFEGILTFVYADYRLRMLGSPRRKLALLGGFDDERRRSRGRVRYIEVGDAGMLSPVRFAMTGGADDLSVNYARLLNADWFVRLQPFLWDDPPDAAESPFFVGSRIEGRDDRFLYLFDARPDVGRMWVARAGGFVSARLSRHDRDIARRIIALRRQGMLLWPVYGLQHFGRHGRAIAQALTLAAEVLSERRGRQIALLSFSPRKAHLPDAEWLESRADKVALLHFGPVGARLYRKVCAVSELPPVVEGQESVSQFIDLDRPFLQLRRTDRTRGFELADIMPHRLARHLDALSRELVERSASGSLAQGPLVRALADFLCDCLDGDGATVDFFSSLKSRPGPDKLEMALAALEIAIRFGEKEGTGG